MIEEEEIDQLVGLYDLMCDQVYALEDVFDNEEIDPQQICKIVITIADLAKTICSFLNVADDGQNNTESSTA